MEEAARRVVVPDLPPEPQPQAAVSAARGETVPPLASVLHVKSEWAHGTVKLVFLPVCRWHHPAWCVTDEEANSATPAMQEFLQAVADRYLPDLVARFIAEADEKHPELLKLAYALAALGMVKYRQVSAAMEKEKPQARVTEIPSRFGSSEPQSEDAIQCEVCALFFENRATLLLHLPCPGPQQPS